MQPENSNIIASNITTEMQTAYLDYAMSVIVSRALPDVRDGLKPVHRRIIYAMQDQNMTASGKYNKSASVVGEVMKKYHPHGDTSIYDALVRMAQDFSLRYTLIDPQGNFGSIDGDSPAAMRYTECRMAKISEELYADIEKETVPFVINDLQNEEPAFLPSKLPNVLLNGASGIAVGMATNIPPHNLNEVIDGITYLIEHADNIGKAPSKDDKDQIATAEFESEATVEDLVKYIKGPDFPTGGTIYNKEEIIQMYATGRGRVVIRAKMEIEEEKGKSQIIVTEIPYQVNKSSLVEKIAENVKKDKIQGVSDLRDESDRDGMRIVIELKKGVVAKKVENQLYKYTQLQNTFNTNMVALLNGEPKLLTLKTILEEFVKHRQEIVIRRAIYLLKKAREHEHILLGLKIALDNLDEVIKLIRASKDAETAKTGLIKRFGLSEIQAQAILDMQLRKLAALERKKIEDELKEIMATIANYLEILASPKRIIDIVKSELLEIKEKYGDERRTKVLQGKAGIIADEDLVANEQCIVTISKEGYIKRLKETSYKTQGRGGKGVQGSDLKDEDAMDKLKICNTHDYALFFTNQGKVYKLRVWEIPEASRTARGTALVNFLGISQSESVESFLTLAAETMEKGNGYIFFATKNGLVKKTQLSEFENIRATGIIAIKLEEGDTLIKADLTSGEDQIMLITKRGLAIRFEEKDARPMGRSAKGVTGLRFKKGGDAVIELIVIPEGKDDYEVFVVAEKGYGKKTNLSEYRIQSRGGSGLLTYSIGDKTGSLVAGRLETTKEGEKAQDVLLATTSGKMIRIEAKGIPNLSRSTKGVRLIRISDTDSVSSVAFLE
ncbi:MAG TPA: DNA gyrase subunit A [candidate division WWE3 bacterium]|uniref:DNA gyrase subunit A n=1 Tax=candidate division WWE3 bacterium TaxID=2053526 RepID=A0A7C1HMF7_UNCKA|nr:DNA gyrase subunit A [candidate division WWE3 bacterium]